MRSLGGGLWVLGCLTIIMNRIFRSPFSFGLRSRFPEGLDRPKTGSSYTSNDGQRNRHPESLSLKVFLLKYWLRAGNALTLSAKTFRNNTAPTTTRNSGQNDANIRRKHCKKP